MAFLPITKKEMEDLGWDAPDFVLVTGDAYVDHPTFGPAIISRVLENDGYHIAILAQPDWQTDRDFTRFGKPQLGFMVTSGNIDSMVAHYTAARRKRSEDAYSPGKKVGLRPDRAVLVYTKKIKEIYPDSPVVIAGLEASLRRFAHYDYWDDAVRPSILIDSGADLLSFGMGEKQTLEIAQEGSITVSRFPCDGYPRHLLCGSYIGVPARASGGLPQSMNRCAPPKKSMQFPVANSRMNRILCGGDE